MNKVQKIVAMLLCGVMLMSPLVSCSKDKNSDDPANNGSQSSEETAKTEVLTNVFKGTSLPLPEEYYISSGVAPYYNEETGEMRVLCRYSYATGEVDEEYGYEIYEYSNIICTMDSSGAVINEVKLELEGEAYINYGTMTDDALYFVQAAYDMNSQKESYYATVYNFADGTMETSEDVTNMFSAEDARWFYVDGMAVDGDGYIYIKADSEVLVLDETLKKSFSVMAVNWISSIVTSNDGVVYANGYFDNGQGFAPIDKATKSFGKTLQLPTSLNSNGFYFGNGYDMFIYNEEGIYGYNFPSEASADGAQTQTEEEVKLLFNFQNSDIASNDVDIMKIVSPDRVILFEREAVTYRHMLVVYDRSADIDLSQMTVLELAYVYSDYDLAPRIVAFNKANDNVRIVARDYSVYNTEADWEAGSKKLVNDILNGLYKPDIVTSTSSRDDTIMQLYQNNLYTDMYQFIDKSERVQRDDLFGCVKRTFEDDAGKLWAIGSSMTIMTMIGPRSLLGDRTSWTMAEMVDFAESLPEGSQLLYGVSKESYATLLGNNGYSSFIDFDANTCNFESEDFISYLEYIATLPATFDYSNYDYSTRYLDYHSGKIALMNEYYYGISDWISEETVFNTKDIVHIGYPASDGDMSGTEVLMTPYVITSYCENPQEAWNFIETIVAPDEDDMISLGGRYGGLSVLKSQFEKECEEYYTYRFEFHFDGSASYGPYDPEYDTMTEEDMAAAGEPGIITYFTEEDAAKLRDWLDNDIGAKVSAYVNEEINNIISEEISSYIGGAKSAADTAHIIQARVSIWLSENE